ncbi:uncharacterized protein LOC143351646 isoform X2 [Colletes latitarsis]|uniref:uncharacterized protein LOC143351646 isoform X2 n=1 Tax=Colletes latitarsis TaxID=2605962 RepID=UPI0040368E0F
MFWVGLVLFSRQYKRSFLPHYNSKDYCNESTLHCDTTKYFKVPGSTVSLKLYDCVTFKSIHLTSLNILELYNKYIPTLAPPKPKIGSEKTVAEEKKAKE